MILTLRGTLHSSCSCVRVIVCRLITPEKSQFDLGIHRIALGHCTWYNSRCYKYLIHFTTFGNLAKAISCIICCLVSLILVGSFAFLEGFCLSFSFCVFMQRLAQPSKQQTPPPQSSSLFPTLKQAEVLPAQEEVGGKLLIWGHEL